MGRLITAGVSFILLSLNSRALLCSQHGAYSIASSAEVESSIVYNYHSNRHVKLRSAMTIAGAQVF